MSDIGVDILKDSLSDKDAGLKKLFDAWNENADFIYELKFDKNDTMLIVLTEIAEERIEVYRVDITRIV